MIPDPQWQAMLQNDGAVCVSLYMPVERAGTEVRQNPIEYKNLLKECRGRLERRGMKSSEAAGFMEPAEALLHDDVFRNHREDGLAVFVHNGEARHYLLPRRFAPRTDAAPHFIVTPLLPLVNSRREYWLLAINRNNVRLYKGGGGELRDVTPKDMPGSLEEALPFENPEESLQWHTGTPHRRGKRPAMFHGQGEKADAEKDRLTRFCRRLADAVRRTVNHDPLPMIPAGVESLISIFRQVSRFQHLTEKQIEGAVDDMSADDLRRAAESILREEREAEQAEDIRRCRERLEVGQQASDRIEDAVLASYDGQIDTLFLADGARVDGVFDSASHVVRLSDTSENAREDLLNFAAIHTCRHGGRVLMVNAEDHPAGPDSPSAAVLRY